MAKDRRRYEPRHVRLYHSVTGSDAWRDLSGNAAKVWIALARLDGGSDNGALFMSLRAGAEMTGLSRNTVGRALIELEDHGFIATVNKGHFRVKGGPATTWRLTDRAAPAAKPQAPTHAYRNWQSGNISRSQSLTRAVPKSDTRVETAGVAVPKSGTTSVETPLVSVNPSIPNIGPQVLSHGHGVSGASSEQRKHPLSDRGDFSADSNPVDEVRSAALLILNNAAPGKQTELARAASIPGGTLSKFLSGRGLARHHLVALQSALADEAAKGKKDRARAA